MINNESISSYELALKVAQEAHCGQLDKGGQPYIKHPLAVSKMLRTEEEKTVALLHDVVEDSSIKLEDLIELGFSHEVIEAVTALTKIKGESYEAYLNRIKHNKTATIVKIADMTHNCDIKRLKHVTDEDIRRVEKYKKAIAQLSSFTCEKCAGTFPISHMGRVPTRQNEIYCDRCFKKYEIEYDEYNDWTWGDDR